MLPVLAAAAMWLSGCAGAASPAGSPSQAKPAALSITVSSLPAGTVQAAYSATLSATGGAVPYTWSITSGSLPPGLTLSPSGQISGTPTQAGGSSFAVQVTDSSSLAQTASTSLSITIAAAGANPVQITTTSLPGGQVNSAYSATLAATGGATPYSWSLSGGSLPAGLSLSAAGQFTGTPTASGTVSFTVRVADSSSPAKTATANLSITIAAVGANPLQITTTSLPSGQVSSAYTAILVATGGTTPYSWSLSGGSLPAGLSLSAAGQITGTPTASGTASFTVQVTDSSSSAQTATANLSIGIASGGGGGGSATVILCPNNGQTGNNANCVQPPTLSFGKQGSNSTSGPLTISVNNCSTSNVAGCTGSGNLTLGTPYFTISGGNAGDFANTGTGTCSNGALVASGSSCTIILRFTPSQAGGTNETATLTVNSNAASSADTMSLTGTSAAVSMISSCQTLSGGTNYQLTSNVSAAGTCFTVGGSNTDLNLNGFTVTYCTSSSSSLVGGVFMDGNPTSGATIHNGTINEGGGTCTGLTPSNGYGSGAIIASSDGGSSASVGTTAFNLALSVKVAHAKVLMEEDAGVSTALGTTMHDVQYTDNDAGNCSSVGCRDLDQYSSIVIDQASHAGGGQFYNITGSGGPQTAINETAPNSVAENNFISPGNVSATVTNGFVYQFWGSNSTIKNNLTAGAGSGGACTSCRGVQISSVNNAAVTGTVVQNNVLNITQLSNDPEYGGCQLEGAHGLQLNTAGSGFDLSNNTFKNNVVTSYAGACPGDGFAFSSGSNGAGPNKTQNNTFSCRYVAGHGNVEHCAGIYFDSKGYSPAPDGSLVSTGDTFSGDKEAVFIWYDGSSSWTCNQCTFEKGPNADSSWLFVDYDLGQSTGGGSSPFTFVDPTFTNGAAANQNNLSAWASNNGSQSFSYTIQWTYTVTVKGGSSGSATSGATVTATDSQGNQECSGTTNASGVFSCVVSDTKYGASGGKYAVTNFNPLAIKISASGCTTLNYSKTILATTSETQTIPGC
jgi:hypothetical protein